MMFIRRSERPRWTLNIFFGRCILALGVNVLQAQEHPQVNTLGRHGVSQSCCACLGNWNTQNTSPIPQRPVIARTKTLVGRPSRPPAVQELLPDAPPVVNHYFKVNLNFVI